jgi:hypothetical protein
MHTWILPLGARQGPEHAWPLLKHSYVECGARFSPGYKEAPPSWIAYTSDETGRFEVYVRDFPEGKCKWQVSGHGGWNPCWRQDGGELFYLNLEGRLMASSLELSSTFNPGIPQSLFDTGLRLTELNIWSSQYAVAKDADQFLLNCRSSDEHISLTAVVPW